jgi:hypothetical protein
MQEWEVQHRPQVRGRKLWHCVCGHGHPRGDDQPEGVPCKVQLCENVKKSAAPIQGRAMHTRLYVDVCIFQFTVLLCTLPPWSKFPYSVGTKAWNGKGLQMPSNVQDVLCQSMKVSLDTNCKRYNLRGRNFVWPPAATLGHLHVARLLFHAHIQLHSYVTLTCIHTVVPEKCSLCEEDGVQEKKIRRCCKALDPRRGQCTPKSAQQPCQRNPSCWKKAIYSIQL